MTSPGSGHEAVKDDDAEEAGARAGLVGHGVYYALLALLTSRLMVAGGRSGEPSPRGALATVAQQPFGQALLVAMTVAFAAYAVRSWRRVADGDEDVWHRLEGVLRGAIWTGLALLAAQTTWSGLTGSGGGGGDKATSLTARVLELPGGVVLVGAVGVAFLGAAARQLWRALDGGLTDELHELGLDERRAARWLGRVGYTGRAVAYGVVGVFVLHAAATHDPAAGGGLDTALGEAQQQPYGTPVLLAVTLGFAAFAAFRLLEARYTSDPT